MFSPWPGAGITLPAFPSPPQSFGTSSISSQTPCHPHRCPNTSGVQREDLNPDPGPDALVGGSKGNHPLLFQPDCRYISDSWFLGDGRTRTASPTQGRGWTTLQPSHSYGLVSSNRGWGGQDTLPPALTAKHPTDRPWGTQAFMSAGATQREGLSCKSNQLPSEEKTEKLRQPRGKPFT